MSEFNDSDALLYGLRVGESAKTLRQTLLEAKRLLRDDPSVAGDEVAALLDSSLKRLGPEPKIEIDGEVFAAEHKTPKKGKDILLFSIAVPFEEGKRVSMGQTKVRLIWE